MKNSDNHTLAIIKPDALKKRLAGKILSIIEENGFQIIAMKPLHLDERDARRFYSVHKNEPFFEGLVAFMTSGPCIPLLLEGENAIEQWRTLMGPTDPSTAPAGTIRNLFGTTIRHNTVHGSDSPENALFEIGFFFSGIDQVEPMSLPEESGT